MEQTVSIDEVSATPNKLGILAENLKKDLMQHKPDVEKSKEI
ncbi:MAG: hypothetical protein ACFFDB_13300 [Promethearchaeota archaeon]